MAERVVRFRFDGSTPYSSGNSYDYTKVGVYGLVEQQVGVLAKDKWAGPLPIALARPVEMTWAVPGFMPHAIPRGLYQWVFYNDNAAATTNRRIGLALYNLMTGQYAPQGFITVTHPSLTNATTRGFRMVLRLHTVGTVSVSGTAVTGTNTKFQFNGPSVGNRIGFGSTDPLQISPSNWFEISAITNDTSITLTASAGTFVAGTPYVIEDLVAVMSQTNSVATSGGLFVAKGLRIELFIAAGTTIAAATSTDRIRACYWLADAATETNTTASGLALEPLSGSNEQFVYVQDGAASNAKFYKYNIWSTLQGLASGKSLTALVLITGTQAVTGTILQLNGLRWATLMHGPASGVPSLYMVTTTRIARFATSGILQGSTTFLSDQMNENPPGSTTTFALTNLMNSLEVSEVLDRLVVLTTGAAGIHAYLTQYRTDGGQMDHILLMDSKQLNQTTESTDAPIYPNTISLVTTCWAQDGVLHLMTHGTTAVTNLMYAIPIGTHWTYANLTGAIVNKQRLVTPGLATPNALKLMRVFTNNLQYLGANELILSLEPFRTYVRSAGITDDSGSWTLMTEMDDLTGLSPSTLVQIMYEFRTVAWICMPARIYEACVTYLDNQTDDHFQFSGGLSDKTTSPPKFAFRYAKAFNSVVPALRVLLQDAVTGGTLTDDNTTSPTGTWEKSTNGGAGWSAWDNADSTNSNTYLRYTPASLGSGIKVTSVLTLL